MPPRAAEIVNAYIISALMKIPVQRRFGFLVNEVGRLYSQQFDRLSREKLGLSQAQCRLLAALAAHEDEPLSQAELAEKVGVTPMAVAALCDRLAAGGWLERRASPHDRRVNHLHIKPSARKALERAMVIADNLTDEVLGALGAAERAQLVTLLAHARERLLQRAGGEETGG
jgi:DNA-binding MarR family transcriptional regulator